MWEVLRIDFTEKQSVWAQKIVYKRGVLEKNERRDKNGENQEFLRKTQRHLGSILDHDHYLLFQVSILTTTLGS